MSEKIRLRQFFPEGPDGQRRFEEMVANVVTSRSQLMSKLMDPRRNLDDECGYPSNATILDASKFQDLYDREAIAARVVEVLPDESWRITPLVYEDEQGDISTQFEEAWDALGQDLRGEDSWYQDEAGSPVWEYLRRADVLSGIGQFGIILLGIDDGKDLREPVDGWPPDNTSGPFSGQGTDAEYGRTPFGFADSPRPKAARPRRTFARKPTGAPGPGGKNGAAPFGYKSTKNGKAPAPPRKNGKAPPFTRNGVYNAGPPEAPLDFAPRGEKGAAPPAKVGPAARTRRPNAPPAPVDVGGEDVSEERDPTEPTFVPKNRLLFLRVLPETLVQVTQYESNPASPRFGQPVLYKVTFNDPRETQQGGIGLTTGTYDVHWSRVIHVADTSSAVSSSEVFAVPRMRPVLNRLLDLRKLYGGSAEMYWRGAFPGYVLSTHPELGGDVEVDKEDLKAQMELYTNGLQRFMTLMGMSMQGVAPQVVDPTAQINVQIQAICIKYAIPQRIFMGSERGELASSQDDSTWTDRIRGRRNNYLTPRMIVPLVDRLILLGVLPEPTGYSVSWPENSGDVDQKKAQVAQAYVAALVQYIAGQGSTLIPPLEFLTKFLPFDEEEAQAMLDAAQAEAERKQQEAMDAQLLAADGMGPPGAAPFPGMPPVGVPGVAPPGAPPFPPGGGTGAPPFAAGPPSGKVPPFGKPSGKPF